MNHAMFGALENRFFLGFRARALSMAFVCFGLAAVAPPGLKGFAGFLQAPPGLAVVALALMAIGLSVEETGTIRRIRIGVGMRILAVVVLVGAVFWGLLLGSPAANLAVMGFILGGLGAIGVGLALQYDWAVYADVRYGQPVRLVEFSRSGLEIESNKGRANLAISDILGIRAVGQLDGRVVVVLVKEEARKKKDLDAFPWIGATPEGDAFALTEHQLGMDLEKFVEQLMTFATEMRGAGK